MTSSTATMRPEGAILVSPGSSHFIKTVSYLRKGGPQNSWSITLDLEEPADDRSLNFQFLGFVQQYEQIPWLLRPEKLLGSQTIARPSGHFISEDGKTIIVYFPEDTPVGDVTDAATQLCVRIEGICAAADKKYCLQGHTHLPVLR